MSYFKCHKKPKGKESHDIPRLLKVRDDFSDFEMDVMELINHHRREKMLIMCTISFDLAGIADPHTEYMISKGKPSHDNFAIRNGLAIDHCDARWLGECVGYAYSSAEGFINGWLKSEGHRKIIESKKAKKFAVSIKQNTKGRNFATLLFI